MKSRRIRFNKMRFGKTRSGKIFRRILRKLSNGETEFGDISTLADSSAVTEVIKKYNQSS